MLQLATVILSVITLCGTSYCSPYLFSSTQHRRLAACCWFCDVLILGTRPWPLASYNLLLGCLVSTYHGNYLVFSGQKLNRELQSSVHSGGGKTVCFVCVSSLGVEERHCISQKHYWQWTEMSNWTLQNSVCILMPWIPCIFVQLHLDSKSSAFGWI